MASTIKLKNGSGAPLASDLVQGEPALDLTNKRLYTEDSLGAVIEVGTNPAAEITANAGIALPDNQKATFGASDDLQIYATGGYSYIDETGTNNLNLRTNGASIGIYDTANSQYMARFSTGGDAELYYNGSEKLATTNTGIDVTGTVTADENITIDTSSGGNGLTIQASGNTSNAITVDANRSGAGSAINQFLGKWNGTNVTDIRFLTGSDTTNKDDGEIAFYTSSAGSLTERMHIANNGDISFYDSAGLSQSFYWDANLESLGIGTTSLTPTDGANIELSSATSARILLDSTGTGGRKYTMASGTAGRLDFYDYDASAYRMVIDSSGNVGIGTTSPLETFESVESVAGEATPILASNKNNTAGTAQNVGYDFGLARNSGAFKSQAGRIEVGRDADWTSLDSNIDAYMSFSTYQNNALVEHMRIDSSGNLLVGRTSTGSSAISGTEVHSDGYTQITRSAASTNPTLHVGKLTNDGEIIRFSKDGTAVGSIGTRAGYLKIGSGDTGLLFNSGGDTIYPENPSTGALRDAAIDLGTGVSRFKDLYLSGNILLGTTSQLGGTNAKLNVSNLGDTYCATLEDDSGATGFIRFNNASGTQVGSITRSGTSTVYGTSSDYRLKENVVDMTGAVDRVKALPVKRFNFIEDPAKTVDGFLAHEAQEVVPEAVTGTKDAMTTEEYEVTPAVLDEDGNVVTEAVMGTREVPDYQGIDQSKLVPLLTGALQEAIARIETLEAQVATLQGN